MRFEDKIVLVTGGSRGIGAAISQSFAQRGANVCVLYRHNEKQARQLVNTMPPGDHLLIRFDLSQSNKLHLPIEKVIAHYGRLDILVNNAGIHSPHPIDEIEFPEWNLNWEETLRVNLMAPANLIYWAAKYMIPQGGGRIVNVSSRGAFRGEPDQPAYGASKAGLNALSQSLARKLAPFNIFVGVVAPGFVDTEMAREVLDGPEGNSIRKQSPLNRVARPEEVAYAVLFLASEGSEFTTGTIIDVNGASYFRS